MSKNTNTGTVYYVYDGEDILAEVDAAGNFLTYYVQGPGIDEPLALAKGTNVYYYHADALGTITQLTNASGAVVQSYDSFGNIVSQSGTVNQPYTYTGREWDAEAWLYYYRARYYDPQVGRFITEDPSLTLSGKINIPFLLLLQLHAPQELNPFTYVGNDPVNMTDPTGLSRLCCGEWRGAASRFVNIWCKCYWLCIPREGPTIWSGNWFAQPSTDGQLVHTGGGGLKRGDACLCKDPDGGGHIIKLMK